MNFKENLFGMKLFDNDRKLILRKRYTETGNRFCIKYIFSPVGN